jgi:hypothetical protein
MKEQELRPRAPRIPSSFQILYSEIDRVPWHAGSMKNVSSSGLLFEGQHRIPPGTPVEMTFLAPSDVFGPAELGTSERVYCTAVIARLSSSESGELVVQMGARFKKWQRLPPRQRSPSI